MVWPLALQKPGLSDRGVANGVAKFRQVKFLADFPVNNKDNEKKSKIHWHVLQ